MKNALVRWLISLVALSVVSDIACTSKQRDSGTSADAAIVDAGPGQTTPTPTCSTPNGVGTQHSGTIGADETWTAADSPHVVIFDLNVVGATLIIEPCAVVRIKEGFTIGIGGSNPGDPPAQLSARGTSDRPVIFTADDPTKYWGTLLFAKTGRGDLEHVVLRRGGALSAIVQNLGGALMILGDGNGQVPTPTVHARSLLIDASASLGINIQRSGGFTADSQDVVVQGSGNTSPTANPDTTYPVYVQTPSVQTIPPGTYTGNFKDAILVHNPNTLDGDETFHERGVPYRIRDELSISPTKSIAEGGLATLTIEAGVTLKLLKAPGNDRGLGLGTSNGLTAENIWATRLVAAGTADKPITITSDAPTPAAGDWSAIHWHGGPASGNVLSYVTVAYAGGRSLTEGFGCGPSSNDAALIFTNWMPADDFLENCTFAHSRGGAIVSGWHSDSGPNLKPGNVFLDIASACVVSQPTPTVGCPDVALCY